MKLVHWPLMGGLLHLVQRGGDWAGPWPPQVPPCCTKCNCITGKSKAKVTNNKKLRSKYCNVKAILQTNTKHRAAALRQQSYLFYRQSLRQWNLGTRHYQPLSTKTQKNQFYVLLFATYFRLRPNRLTLSKIGTKISMILY